MAFVVPFLPAIAAGVTAVAAIQQGNAARAASKYNAELGRQNAVAAKEEAAQMAEQQARENYLRLGAIRAAHGKSGGVADAGSVLDVIGDVVAQGELQKQFILKAGERKARGYEAGATLDEAGGRNAQRTGYLAAAGSLLGAAGKVPSGSSKLKMPASYGYGSAESPGAYYN